MSRPGRKRNSLRIRKPSGGLRQDKVGELHHRIYFAGNGLGAVKVGLSTQVAHRLDHLQVANPEQLEIYGFIDMPSHVDAARLEVNLHRFLKGRGRHIRGEWFKLTKTEVDIIERQFGAGHYVE